MSSTVIFDLAGFTPILPFDNRTSTILGMYVQSDHAEVQLQTPGKSIVNIWNISNPVHHGYFKSGPKPPFHNTQLYYEQPLVDGNLHPGLVDKVSSQIDTIAERFVKGTVNIQIIVEGSEFFYTALTEKIGRTFEIIRAPTEKLHKNSTGILVDTSRFTVISSEILKAKYKETEEAKEDQELIVPCVTLLEKASNQTMMIAGVHIHGCDWHYPKEGLKQLAKALHSKMDSSYDLIAGGDFNTPPMHAAETLLAELGDRASLQNASYPTHVNPRSEATIYDQFVVVQGKESSNKYEVLSSDTISTASKSLIDSIEFSRKHYLGL